MKKILVLLLSIVFYNAKAQTKEETTSWLSEHISTECFTDVSSGSRSKSELKSISCDDVSLNIKWEHTSYSAFGDGNDKVFIETITVPLDQILSINTSYTTNNRSTIRIITKTKGIAISRSSSYKEIYGDDKELNSNVSTTEIYFNSQCADTGLQPRIIKAFNHLVLLNKQSLPKEAF